MLGETCDRNEEVNEVCIGCCLVLIARWKSEYSYSELTNVCDTKRSC